MEEEPRVKAKLAAIGKGDRVCITPTVKGEIFYGVFRLAPGRRRETMKALAEALFNSIPCEIISPGVAEHYAALKCEALSKGKSMADNDLWIAAAAMELGAVLVTRDSDFRNVKGLAVEDWTV